MSVELLHEFGFSRPWFWLNGLLLLFRAYLWVSMGALYHVMRTQPPTPLTLQEVGNVILLYVLPYAGFSNLKAFQLSMREDFSGIYYEKRLDEGLPALEQVWKERKRRAGSLNKNGNSER